MSGFEPGAGWREVTAQGYVEASATTITLREDGRPDRWWVREAPVPPLPTEPYTVIRVTWRDPDYLTGSHIYFLASDDYWVPQNRNAPITDRVDLQPRITGFEVLAEPREVADWRYAEAAKITQRRIAKAVVARVREVFDETRDGRSLNETLAVVASEFEAQS